jgi:NAD-dependent SIR2 family protein deacetylase
VSAPQVGSIDRAAALLLDSGFVALTGAGMSTDSGIPDYRGPGAVNRSPMTYAEFVSGPRARQRYWARSYVGWTRMRDADPNPGHVALARIQEGGVCRGLVTQNVDGLHERVGSPSVIALHGRLSDVVCLDCGTLSSRPDLQRRMELINPGWLERQVATVEDRPDGDVEIADTGGFHVPACETCGGVLKPDVVYFGESVPKPRVQRCYDLVDTAPALLVLGSSLTVMSGLRFVRYAAKAGTPVVIVNRGETRGDPLATLTLHEGTSEFLAALLTRVSDPVAQGA